MQQEAGHTGQIMSLGGLLSSRSSGRVVNSWGVNLSGTTVQTPVGENQKRISLYIYNLLSSANQIIVRLGPILSTDDVVYLQPGEGFQIDNDFPWTGPVSVVAPVGTATTLIEEIAIR